MEVSHCNGKSNTNITEGLELPAPSVRIPVQAGQRMNHT